MEIFSTLAEYGATGIAIALIVLLGFVIRKLFTFMSNHIKHNTRSLVKLSEAIDNLNDVIENKVEDEDCN
mgnify:CR=1 FL=1